MKGRKTGQQKKKRVVTMKPVTTKPVIKWEVEQVQKTKKMPVEIQELIPIKEKIDDSSKIFKKLQGKNFKQKEEYLSKRIIKYLTKGNLSAKEREKLNALKEFMKAIDYRKKIGKFEGTKIADFETIQETKLKKKIEKVSKKNQKKFREIKDNIKDYVKEYNKGKGNTVPISMMEYHLKQKFGLINPKIRVDYAKRKLEKFKAGLLRIDQRLEKEMLEKFLKNEARTKTLKKLKIGKRLEMKKIGKNLLKLEKELDKI